MSEPQSTIVVGNNTLIEAASGTGISIINEIQKYLDGKNYIVPTVLTAAPQSLAWMGADRKAVLFNAGSTPQLRAEAETLISNFMSGVVSAPKRTKAKNMANGTKAVLTNDAGVPLKDFADNALEVGNEN